MYLIIEHYGVGAKAELTPELLGLLKNLKTEVQRLHEGALKGKDVTINVRYPSVDFYACPFFEGKSVISKSDLEGIPTIDIEGIRLNCSMSGFWFHGYVADIEDDEQRISKEVAWEVLESCA